MFVNIVKFIFNTKEYKKKCKGKTNHYTNITALNHVDLISSLKLTIYYGPELNLLA